MPERLPDINLLPQYERQSERFFYYFVSFTIIVIISFILLGVFYFITKSQLDTAESELNQLVTEEESLQAEMDWLDMDEVPTLENAVTFVERQIYETSTFITHLEDLLPANSYLSHYEYRGDSTSITTQFATLSNVASYTTNLTESDFIHDAKVNNIGAVSSEEDSDEISYYDTRFSLTVNKHKLKKESKENE